MQDVDVSELADIDNTITTLHRKLTALAEKLARRERFVYGALTERYEAYCHSALTELAKNPDLIPAEAELPELLEVLTLASCLRASFGMLGEMDKLTLEIEETIGGDLLAAAIDAHVILNVAEREHDIPPLHEKNPIRRTTGEHVQIGKTRH
ncbi:hypothetical protein [Hydrocarboniphaga sp.]|uniref:hypothetical protein n=1 Tax=Hydrocarboniphaga sp. TaxID=2033016 RepID=UPI002634DB01|nr:hypothetical protein [Hydrocarboniphaga sp.]